MCGTGAARAPRIPQEVKLEICATSYSVDALAHWGAKVFQHLALTELPASQPRGFEPLDFHQRPVAQEMPSPTSLPTVHLLEQREITDISNLVLAVVFVLKFGIYSSKVQFPRSRSLQFCTFYKQILFK